MIFHLFGFQSIRCMTKKFSLSGLYPDFYLSLPSSAFREYHILPLHGPRKQEGPATNIIDPPQSGITPPKPAPRTSGVKVPQLLPPFSLLSDHPATSNPEESEAVPHPVCPGVNQPMHNVGKSGPIHGHDHPSWSCALGLWHTV